MNDRCDVASSPVRSGTKKLGEILSWVAFVAFLAAFTFVVLDDLRLRRLARALLSNQSHATEATAPPPLVGKGQTIDVVVRTRDGSSKPLTQLVGSQGAVVWLFEPDCPLCAEEALELSYVLREPIARQIHLVGVTRADPGKTLRFLKSNGVEIEVFQATESDGRDQRLRAVPQMFSIDSKGRVVQEFRSPFGMLRATEPASVIAGD